MRIVDQNCDSQQVIFETLSCLLACPIHEETDFTLSERTRLWLQNGLVSAQRERSLREDAIEKARQADVVVMCLGLSPLVEGEEMEVPFEGFRGGDRTSIDLPKAQEELLKEVQALGKPVVLVLLNGSALAVNWANDHVPAILGGWYSGEEGGTAIADVLFGDYNPAGRLPVTFYKSVNQLPPFTDYSMQGRTYRCFKGDPLYPLGFDNAVESR